MPCETFASTGASPAFGTSLAALGATIAPTYSADYYAASLSVCTRVAYTGPLGYVQLSLRAFGGADRTRPLVGVTPESKQLLLGGGVECPAAAAPVVTADPPTIDLLGP